MILITTIGLVILGIPVYLIGNLPFARRGEVVGRAAVAAAVCCVALFAGLACYAGATG